MSVPTPEWLTARNGALKLGSDGRTWYFLWNNEPQYALVPTPVGGRFGCYIKQTINGQPVECKARAEDPDAAITAGLHELKTYLGW